jgi:hypothetical protein
LQLVCKAESAEPTELVAQSPELEQEKEQWVQRQWMLAQLLLAQLLLEQLLLAYWPIQLLQWNQYSYR